MNRRLAELLNKPVPEYSAAELSQAAVMAEIGLTNTVIITALGHAHSDHAGLFFLVTFS